MIMECLITGLSLCREDYPYWAAADLHRMGSSTWIVVANVDKRCETNWQFDTPFYSRRLTIPVGQDYFERRGIFVLPADFSILNREAQEYIAKWTT